MRAVVTIIVAVMSVVTGGPLRCPCQFATMFRAVTCSTESTSAVRIPQTPQSAADHSGCGCKAHMAADDQPPEERHPVQPEPCNHGPGTNIDLVAPTTVDRQSRDFGAFNISCAVTSGVHLTYPALLRHGITASPRGSDSTLPTLLRFSHAFRC